MTEQEKRFFEKIEEASKENPIVRIGAAGDFITGLLKRAFTNEKGGTDANMWGYMAAVLTGLSPQKYVENNAKNMGKDIKLWNNQHDPYEEISSAKNTYGSVRKLLEPYKLEPTEYHMAFALALGNIIPACEKVFPKKLNCFDMAIETMMFVAHME